MNDEKYDDNPPSPTASSEPAGDQFGYDALERKALELGEKVAAAEVTLDEKWELLLPTLHKMQNLLSQHGEDYEPRSDTQLPTWQDWLEAFLPLAGIKASVRTVERRLADYRDRIYGPRERKSITVTRPKQKPEQMTFGGTETVGTTHYEPAHYEESLKPGDRNGLADSMLGRCGSAGVSALLGLSPEAKGKVLEYALRKYVRGICGATCGDAQIIVEVRVLKPNPLDVRGKRMSRDSAPSVDDRIRIM